MDLRSNFGNELQKNHVTAKDLLQLAAGLPYREVEPSPEPDPKQTTTADGPEALADVEGPSSQLRGSIQNAGPLLTDYDAKVELEKFMEQYWKMRHAEGLDSDSWPTALETAEDTTGKYAYLCELDGGDDAHSISSNRPYGPYQFDHPSRTGSVTSLKSLLDNTKITTPFGEATKRWFSSIDDEAPVVEGVGQARLVYHIVSDAGRETIRVPNMTNYMDDTRSEKSYIAELKLEGY
jgi:hypothetical protein